MNVGATVINGLLLSDLGVGSTVADCIEIGFNGGQAANAKFYKVVDLKSDLHQLTSRNLRLCCLKCSKNTCLGRLAVRLWHSRCLYGFRNE